MVELAILVLTSPNITDLERPKPIRGFEKASNNGSRHILAQQSLFFETPYVWDDRRPRPRIKERSPCRAVGHVHERRLDSASNVK